MGHDAASPGAIDEVQRPSGRQVRQDVLARPEPLEAPVREAQDLVRQAENGRPVADEHDGRARRLQRLHRAGERALRRGIEVGARLVEHHEARRAEHRARERDALALAGREPLASGADLGAIALGRRRIMRARRRAGRRAPPPRRPPAEARDVVAHDAGEELRVLRQVADVRAELGPRPGGEVGAVEADDAGGRLHRADNQPCEARLAGPRRAEDASASPGSAANETSRRAGAAAPAG